jgi:hypothetical protein
MNKLFGAAAFAIALGAVIPAMAASDADCKVKWDKADVNKSGTLEGKEAAVYLDAIALSGKTYDLKAAGELTSAEFMLACKEDAFRNETAGR